MAFPLAAPKTLLKTLTKTSCPWKNSPNRRGIPASGTGLSLLVLCFSVRGDGPISQLYELAGTLLRVWAPLNFSKQAHDFFYWILAQLYSHVQFKTWVECPSPALPTPTTGSHGHTAVGMGCPCSHRHSKDAVEKFSEAT